MTVEEAQDGQYLLRKIYESIGAICWDWWNCLEKSKTDRCNWEHSTSIVTQKRQEKIWSTAVHVLSTGAELLSQPSGRLRRNDDGLSSGMDRLKCVGNAVMPQQILPIFKAIVEIEEQIYDQ